MDILFTRIGGKLVSKVVVQGNIFNLNRWRKEENEQNHRGFLLITQENGSADTTLEHQNEPSPEVFQESKIHSCAAEVFVRITDDRRFLNKTRIGCRGKESVAQFGEEELKSSVKRRIEEVFVCHQDRTRITLYITKSGIVRGRSWTRQILSDAGESMIAETKL